MATSMEVHEFAFGRDYVEDAVCPVVAHQGTGPVDIQLDAAEWYDKKAQEMVGDESGVISKEQAREAWSRAIDALREFARRIPRRKRRVALHEHRGSVRSRSRRIGFLT